jgi:3-hydroxyisobutyrate dehydrogenase-like beta-hydroxyacid dehydrogenase
VDAQVKAAVIGTGRMGAAMAARLAQGGVEVTVYNRTRSRAEAVAAGIGATVADTARAAAAAAPVVLVSLADDAAADAAYQGPDGIAAGVADGTVVCDASTVDPETAVRTATLVRAAGGAALDTPVSGSVSTVESGKLAVLVGGDAADLERARPVLDHIAARIFHLGPAGAGAAMKLAVNGVVHALNQAVSEALVVAESAGISRSDAYDVLAAGAVGAPFVHYKRAAFLDPDGTPVAFTLDLVAKDLDLLVTLADRVGAPVDQARANRAAVGEAVATGMGEADISAIAVHLRDRARRDATR